MNIIIWGYGIEGVKLYRELVNDADYKVIGFADNSIYKQGNIVGKFTILSMQDLLHLKLKIDFSVIIAARQWFIVGEELEKHDISIEGIYQNGSIAKYDRMTFKRLDFSKTLCCMRETYVTMYICPIPICTDYQLINQIPDISCMILR